jgi:hypothetical protein
LAAKSKKIKVNVNVWRQTQLMNPQLKEMVLPKRKDSKKRKKRMKMIL